MLPLAREKSDYKHPFPGEIKTVRDLSIAYGAICDVMRYLDDGHGLLLLFIIGSFFLQLIITPYYLINAIYTSTGRINSIFLQICWCIYHFLCMLVVVEPGYQTQKEMDKIQVLVFYLMRFVAPMDPMLVDLNIFYKQLHENRPQYTPFGMCILSRHLTVTIIGAVTTYLVIIFQFRAYENK
ncbi:gustatory receptor for sugar taste 43a-like [Melitaea cinxia]|uniref:gustatory receptor for sugar taste 43a-like n=1 Tax=Melitaea cinxia TaxID=113334 RepID=UPI001E26FF97|nr:gustatory receptor for sugar taste 43a-like [Melitaea cinxia]